MRTASLLLLLPFLSCRTTDDRLAPGERVWFQDVAWSPDGANLAVTRGVFAPSGDWKTEIWILDPDQGNPRRLTGGAANEIWPSWSADGSKFVFASGGERSRDVWIANADGSDPVRLTDDRASDTAPTLSPDGRRVAFMSDRDGLGQIFVVATDGTGLRRLSAGTMREEHPRWSPDGRWIAFHGGAPGARDDIWVMRPDGTGRRRIASGGVFPMWLPSGTALAFSGDGGVYLVGLDGGAPALHLPGAMYAAWSSDAGRIATISRGEGRTGVFVRPAGGTSPTCLMEGPGPPW